MLPLAGAALDKEPDTGRAEIVLPVFRSAAASWVAAIGPTQADEVRTAAGSAAVAAAAADDIAAQGSARSTARAATTAASTGGVTVADVSERWRLPAAFPSTLAARGSAMRSAFGRAATRSVALRAATTRSAATKAVRADVAALPLWPDGPPDTVAKA